MLPGDDRRQKPFRTTEKARPVPLPQVVILRLSGPGPGTATLEGRGLCRPLTILRWPLAKARRAGSFDDLMGESSPFHLASDFQTALRVHLDPSRTI